MRRMPAFSAMALALASLSTPTNAQSASAPNWAPFERILGEWIADAGSGGAPGMASRGGETWAFDLDKRVIVRRDYSDYPASTASPARHHEGLMVISPTNEGGFVAHAYDNEGHDIVYAVVASDSSLVMTSGEANGQPQFRLTYALSASRTIIQFDIAPPGSRGAFRSYVTGSEHRAPVKP